MEQTARVEMWGQTFQIAAELADDAAAHQSMKRQCVQGLEAAGFTVLGEATSHVLEPWETVCEPPEGMRTVRVTAKCYEHPSAYESGTEGVYES